MKIIRKVWRWFWTPTARFAWGAIVLAGFVGGIIFWGGLHTAMEATNTLEFCISCHEMRDTVYVEYKKSVHYKNASGVRAVCSDCHVPHNWTDKVARKMQASKEVWGTIFGTINTREKFQAKRLELAQREWLRFKSNNSLECRNCHSEKAMDFTRQSKRAAEAHERLLVPGEKTCIDCHKGIAHELPAMPPAASLQPADDAGATSQLKQYLVQLGLVER